MSNIYITEPPTNGKVLLRTSVGEIEIELWSKECPKAARNFVQLCLEGYYDNTVFHRLVPDFIVQGGDPTGTGEGGESIYGKPFRTETHSRLRFNRRGLVAMAAPEVNENKSQFFFTLGATPELDRKHTIFGKVVGNTLYNMLNLNSDEVDQNERPVHLHRVFKTEVISNPFPDIEPRALKKTQEEKEEDKPKSTARATKNFKLLSFGEEAEEEEEELSLATDALSRRGKSSHDLLDDPRLSKDAVAVDSALADAAAAAAAIARALAATTKAEEEEAERRRRKEQQDEEEEKKDRVRREIDSLQKELRRKTKEREEEEEEEEEEGPEKKRMREENEKEEQNDPVKQFMMERKKFKEHRVPPKKKSRERETMALFESFRAKLVAKAGTTNNPHNDSEDSGEEVEERGGGGGIGQMEDYLAHRMIAEEKAPVLAMDASSAKDHERYDLYDPRNPLNKRRRGEKKEKKQKG